MKKMILLLLASTVLGGCAAGGHCLGEYDYQHAYSLPSISNANVKAAGASSALVIPPPPARVVPFGSLVDDPKNPGDTAAQCLDVPPGLPTLTEQPLAATPTKS